MQSVNLSGIGTGATNELQVLSVSALSGDVSVVPHPSVDYSSPAENGLLSFTPVAGATGQVTITVAVVESGGVLTGGTNRVERAFTVNVSGPGPALLVEQANGAAIISWPTNSPVGWRLESTTNLSAGGSWTSHPATPALVNGRLTVTNAPEGVTRFYRLRNQ